MAFNYDETNPTGAMFIADFPANEQAHRLAVVSSALVDHDAEGLGEHSKISLQPHTGDPSTSSDAGFIYAKVDSGLTELFYMDDAGTVVQLTIDGSASPDKLPLAGGTMSGDIIFDGTAEIKLLNALAVLGQDVGVANYRNLIQVDANDFCEIGDQSLDGGLRLNADDIDSAVIAYGDDDKKIWHAGDFAAAPRFTTLWESAELAIETPKVASVAHDVGAIPTLWSAVLRCTSAEFGWEVDEELLISSQMFGSATNESGFNLSVTSSHFHYRIVNVSLKLSKSDGIGEDALDESKWVLVFRAWY